MRDAYCVQINVGRLASVPIVPGGDQGRVCPIVILLNDNVLAVRSARTRSGSKEDYQSLPFFRMGTPNVLRSIKIPMKIHTTPTSIVIGRLSILIDRDK